VRRGVRQVRPGVAGGYGLAVVGEAGRGRGRVLGRERGSLPWPRRQNDSHTIDNRRAAVRIPPPSKADVPLLLQ